MKNKVIIGSIVLVSVAAIGGVVWKQYFSCCGKGDYNTRMSIVCRMGCAKKDYDKNQLVVNSTAKPGEITKCPISGVVFTVTESTGSFKYKNKEYHTCCGSCAGIFNAAPAQYAGNLN